MSPMSFLKPRGDTFTEGACDENKGQGGKQGKDRRGTHNISASIGDRAVDGLEQLRKSVGGLKNKAVNIGRGGETTWFSRVTLPPWPSTLLVRVDEGRVVAAEEVVAQRRQVRQTLRGTIVRRAFLPSMLKT